MSVHPSRLLRAVAANNAASPLAPHHRTALTAKGYHWLLTPGDKWFLDCVSRLTTISARQQARLNEVAAKVERGRR